MANNYSQYRQRFIPHQRVCEILMDSDRIELRTQECKPALLKRVADAIENEALCAYTVVEEDVIILMQPDYGMFAADDELRDIVSEIFREHNYEIIYKD